MSFIQTILALLSFHSAVAMVSGQVNDHFENASTLSGDTATATGVNSDATLQPGEPTLHDQASLWWRWTAPTTGLVVIDTSNSTFNTTLAAYTYTGGSVSNLAAVAANDNVAGVLTSRITFQTAVDETYYIAVGARGIPFGCCHVTQLHLQFTTNSGPSSVVGRDAFDLRQSLVGTEAIGLGNNVNAWYQPDEVPHLGNGRTLWWTWTAPALGRVWLDDAGSEADTVLGVYVGTEMSQLLPVRLNGNLPEEPSARVSFQVAPGTSYQIVADSVLSHLADGNITLNLHFEPNEGSASVVGTDDFGRPHELTDWLAHGVANSHYAGVQPGEPLASGSSVWWSWTGPAAGTFVVDTLGSDFDTTLTVFTGTSLTNLLLAGYSNDDGTQRTSRVEFNALAGQRYHFMVAGNPAVLPRTGNIDLHLSPARCPDSVVRVHPAIEVEFFACGGLRHQLQRSFDLRTWQDVGAPFTGSNAVIKWFFPTRFNEREFYRTRLLAP